MKTLLLTLGLKKVLFALMAIAVVASLLTGGTLAYFTSSATSEDNELTAGTLVVSLGGTDNEGTPVTSPAPFFAISAMAPGDTTTACVEVRNDGTLDMLYRMYLTNVVQTTVDSTDFADQLEVTVTLRPSSVCSIPGGYTAYGTADEVAYGPGSLSGIIGQGNALDNEDDAFGIVGPLEPDYVAVYKVDIELPFLTTGNEWQGASFTSDLQIDATQFANQTQSSVAW